MTRIGTPLPSQVQHGQARSIPFRVLSLLSHCSQESIPIPTKAGTATEVLSGTGDSRTALQRTGQALLETLADTSEYTSRFEASVSSPKDDVDPGKDPTSDEPLKSGDELRTGIPFHRPFIANTTYRQGVCVCVCMWASVRV